MDNYKLSIIFQGRIQRITLILPIQNLTDNLLLSINFIFVITI